MESSPDSVLVYEEWTSKAALDADPSSDYFKNAGAILIRLMDGPPERVGPWGRGDASGTLRPPPRSGLATRDVRSCLRARGPRPARVGHPSGHAQTAEPSDAD